MSISNVGARDNPFAQLLVRVHAKQGFNSPRPQEVAGDVTIFPFHQVSIMLG